MKKARFKRRLAALLLICVPLTLFSACGGDGSSDDLEIPSITGAPLNEWPGDEVFRTVPQFTEGTFDKENSTLKSGHNIMVFTGVETAAYDAYYQSIADQGFTDVLQGGGGTITKNARFLNEEETIVVRLSYKVSEKTLTITLLHVVEEEG